MAAELVGLGFTTSDARTKQRVQANVTVFGGGDLNFTAASVGQGGDTGFFFANVGRGKGSITISKPGYKTRTIECDFPIESNIDFAIEPEAHVRPTREQVLAVRTSGCSMRDSQGRVMFTDSIGYFWLEGQLDNYHDWLNRLKEECTADDPTRMPHILLAFRDKGYPGYWVPGFDFTGHEDAWRAMLTDILDHGVIPFIMYTTGDTAEELDQLEHRMRASIEFTDYSVSCMGYEMIGSQNATLSSRKWFDTMQLMRSITGESGVLAMHVDPAERSTWASARGYNHDQPVPGCWWKQEYENGAPKLNDDGSLAGVWVENDDPSQGDEVGAMRLLTPDILAMQLRHGSDGPASTIGDLNDLQTWAGHMVEIADRQLPDGAIIPGLNRAVRTGPARNAPDWYRGHAKRPRFCIFETVWYEYCKGQCSEQQAIAASEQCRRVVPDEGGYRRSA